MPRTKLYLLLGLTSCMVGGITFLFVVNAAYRQPRVQLASAAQPSIQPTPITQAYEEVLTTLKAERLRLASRFQHATVDERTALLTEARTIITRSIYSDLLPAWYGTAWDFNGTSETPRQGKIACGYFVSTILRDAGWKVERVRLAQQASENIILSLTEEPFVKRFRHVPIGEFVAAVKEWGPGIYIVGLDIHVGFIVNTGGEVYFIHSSYVDPYAVVREKALESRILSESKYRVLGNVLADDGFVSKWLAGTAIPTRIASGQRPAN